MNASPHSSPNLARRPDVPGGIAGKAPGIVPGKVSSDVLGELLHSLSQPLTSLRCSLELSLEHSFGRLRDRSRNQSPALAREPSCELTPELSIEDAAEQQQESVAAALQQTEKVVGMVQLMREYLEAEQPGPKAFSTALEPTLRSVIEELSSIASVRAVRLRLTGRATATLPLPESQLRRALQYLIAALIEAQPAGGTVTLLLGEDPAEAVLRAEGEQKTLTSQTNRSSAEATLRGVRLAIANRVLETAGASLVFAGGLDLTALDHAGIDPGGFVLRIPRA